MDGILSWLKQLEFGFLLDTAGIVLAALLSITVHETCHGLVAFWLGDDTAKRQGRLSLNPLRHVDLMGLVLMALARFGWAKPVPIDARHFRHPKLGMVFSVHFLTTQLQASPRASRRNSKSMVLVSA